MKRIAIVTPDLTGFVRNGGVGTACKELSETFAKAGHSVTILFSQSSQGQQQPAQHNEAAAISYANNGISVISAEQWLLQQPDIGELYPCHEQLKMSLIVHEWLKSEESFDIVFFMDWQGHGFCALSGKRSGSSHCHHGEFTVVCHGPSLWSHLASGSNTAGANDGITYFMERRTVELAERVISPSHYMIKWMKEHGFNLPKNNQVVPNPITLESGIKGPRNPRTVVFFGRLEYRKGLTQFCKALSALAAEGIGDLEVVFLGKFGNIGDKHAASYIFATADRWPFELKILSYLQQPDALAYLRAKNPIVVVPSLIDNLPYTVYECLASGLFVVSSNVGGIPELYAASDHSTHLFSDNPISLMQTLRAAIQEQLPTPSLAFCASDAKDAWIELTRNASKANSEEKKLEFQIKENPKRSKPVVSICVATFQRPHFLAQLLRSLVIQTFKDFEVILVDDGSTDSSSKVFLNDIESMFSRRGWTIIRGDHAFAGKARNRAACAANGEYLIFMDDDNLAATDMVERYLTAITLSGYDIVTSHARVFEGRDISEGNEATKTRYSPVGGALGYALIGNSLSDTNVILKKELFFSLGGFTEDYGVGHEDFELWIKAVNRGYKILVIPETLYWYRKQDASNTVTNSTTLEANRSRELRGWTSALGPDIFEAITIAHSIVYNSCAELPVKRGRGTRGDPNSADSIFDVCIELIKKKQFCHAQTLMKCSLGHGKSDDPELGNMCAMAIECSVRGDIDCVRQLMHSAAHHSNPLGRRWVLELSAQAAWAAHQRISLELLEEAAASETELNEISLCWAEAADKFGKPKEALNAYNTIMLYAGREYLEARKDVKRALEKGAFKSAIDHYWKYGRYERCSWPGIERLRRLSSWEELS
jgi:glycosyltransferase involved in cell wall biosynthesis